MLYSMIGESIKYKYYMNCKTGVVIKVFDEAFSLPCILHSKIPLFEEKRVELYTDKVNGTYLSKTEQAIRNSDILLPLYTTLDKLYYTDKNMQLLSVPKDEADKLTLEPIVSEINVGVYRNRENVCGLDIPMYYEIPKEEVEYLRVKLQTGLSAIVSRMGAFTKEIPNELFYNVLNKLSEEIVEKYPPATYCYYDVYKMIYQLIAPYSFDTCCDHALHFSEAKRDTPCVIIKASKLWFRTKSIAFTIGCSVTNGVYESGTNMYSGLAFDSIGFNDTDRIVTARGGMRTIDFSNQTGNKFSFSIKDCINLEELILPADNTVAEMICIGCTNLKKIVNSKNISAIAGFGFIGCDNLTELDLSGLQGYKKGNLIGLPNLNKLRVPENLASSIIEDFKEYYKATIHCSLVEDNIVEITLK